MTTVIDNIEFAGFGMIGNLKWCNLIGWTGAMVQFDWLIIVLVWLTIWFDQFYKRRATFSSPVILHFATNENGATLSKEKNQSFLHDM